MALAIRRGTAARLKYNHKCGSHSPRMSDAAIPARPRTVTRTRRRPAHAPGRRGRAGYQPCSAWPGGDVCRAALALIKMLVSPECLASTDSSGVGLHCLQPILAEAREIAQRSTQPRRITEQQGRL